MIYLVSLRQTTHPSNPNHWHLTLNLLRMNHLRLIWLRIFSLNWCSQRVKTFMGIQLLQLRRRLRPILSRRRRNSFQMIHCQMILIMMLGVTVKILRSLICNSLINRKLRLTINRLNNWTIIVNRNKSVNKNLMMMISKYINPRKSKSNHRLMSLSRLISRIF